MARKPEFWGTLWTVVYLVVIAFTVAIKFDDFLELKLNELGDFLAGVFGPIAFLWLVLGYLQQGRELKLSSEALRMQADELKASVEQQAIMAAAATDQLRSQRAALDLQVWRHEKEISPDFEVSAFITMPVRQDRSVTSCLRIINRGHDVRFVLFRFDQALGVNDSINFGDLKSGSYGEDVSFHYHVPEEMFIGRCYVEYLRADHKTLTVEFSYKVSANDGAITIEKTAPSACS